MLKDSTYKENSVKPQIVAVIDIGATSLRMQIAQVTGEGTVEKLESLSQAVSIGKASFIKGFIDRQTIEDCVHVLKIYRQKLEEYGVTEKRNIRVVATSGVQEASNRLAFQDRVYVATGFDIEPFDLAELHRVTYLGILPYFARQPEYFTEHTALCEVGGGTTELILLDGIDVDYSTTLRLGALRLRKMLDAYDAPVETARTLYESQIAKTVNQMHAIADQTVQQFISMGSEIRFIAGKISQTTIGDDLIEIPLSRLEKIIDDVLSMSAAQIANQYHMALPDAQTFGPALLTHHNLARSLGVDRIMVANVNLRDSLVKEMVSRGSWSDSIQSQVVRSAIQLGRKFDFDEAHASHVSMIALQLFDQLVDQHQLGIRMRSILRLASLLHEIGRFIGESSFHKHTLYLIRNSELFGIGASDLKLIALVARYHRRASPQPSHDVFSRLNRSERVAVAKLAAILRIANAMDEGRTQNINDFDCRVVADRVQISVRDSTDISLEQLAVSQAKKLFEEIYGVRLFLQQGEARP